MNVNEFLEKKKSVEKCFKDEINKLKWNYSDVLYSFLGVYVIGLYVFDKESKKEDRLFRKSERGVIFLKKCNQKLYANKYIIENKYYENEINESLNKLDELQNFLDKYYSIGNLIPIWPGGNENRGKFGCYDLPEFYFSNKIITPWINFLENNYNAYLNPIIEHKKIIFNNGKEEYCFSKGISNFLEIVNIDMYKNYLKEITNIIEIREKYFDKYLKKN